IPIAIAPMIANAPGMIEPVAVAPFAGPVPMVVIVPVVATRTLAPTLIFAAALAIPAVAIGQITVAIKIAVTIDITVAGTTEIAHAASVPEIFTEFAISTSAVAEVAKVVIRRAWVVRISQAPRQFSTTSLVAIPL
ncbi:MAG: hypothetical protein L0228_18360, partial [Planctomycetes bacterium]|nr:hypothetical protein [Planctomycetota bacterium]